MELNGIAPAKPPLPICPYRPFHVEVGIQTSKPRSESLVGWMRPATRQNSGKPASAAVLPGGVKLPAGIVCAALIVVSASDSPARPSQSVMAACAATGAITNNAAAGAIQAAMRRAAAAAPFWCGFIRFPPN